MYVADSLMSYQCETKCTQHIIIWYKQGAINAGGVTLGLAQLAKGTSASPFYDIS